MNVILLLSFGLAVGAIARIVVPGRATRKWVPLFLGVLGSFVGAFLGQLLGPYSVAGPSAYFVAVFGALACVLAYLAIERRALARTR